MKKLSLLLITLFLVPTFFLSSCDRGDDLLTTANTPAFTLMTEYMVGNNLDIDKIISDPDGVKFVTAAPEDADLSTFLAKYYIMDIRSATDYANGHIQGAQNIAFENILTDAVNAGDKPILVVCYTGQTACYGTALLRLYGYTKTQALKWGMSGWNTTTAGSWNGSIGDSALGNPNWSYSAEPSKLVFSDPTLSSFSTSGSDILKQRVELVVAEGFKGVAAADVIASPSAYFVNNYFSAADYQSFGHISNAHRILPLTIADNSYKNLDPNANARIATYCYTGQTSAVVTACLRVLGYDAYSIKFGMNGLYNSNGAWVSNKWSSSVSKNLPLVN
jgi:rhodanese-related sulfurtransferase